MIAQRWRFFTSRRSSQSLLHRMTCVAQSSSSRRMQVLSRRSWMCVAWRVFVFLTTKDNRWVWKYNVARHALSPKLYTWIIDFLAWGWWFSVSIVSFQGFRSLHVPLGLSVFQVEMGDINGTQTHLSEMVNEALQVCGSPFLLALSTRTHLCPLCHTIYFNSSNMKRIRCVRNGDGLLIWTPFLLRMLIAVMSRLWR